MTDAGDFRVLPATDADREWLHDHFVRVWGETLVVGFGPEGPIRFDLPALPALVAWHGSERVGALVWTRRGEDVEVASIAVEMHGGGVGRALLRQLATDAATEGVARISLTTTNDNLTALAFYQRCGMRVCAVYPDGVDRAREEKPAIPLLGQKGIPMHDAIELDAGPVDILAATSGPS